MQITTTCNNCCYYTNGNCNMDLLEKRSVRPNDYCSYWMSDRTGIEHVGNSIILVTREEKK